MSARVEDIEENIEGKIRVDDRGLLVLWDKKMEQLFGLSSEKNFFPNVLLEVYKYTLIALLVNFSNLQEDEILDKIWDCEALDTFGERIQITIEWEAVSKKEDRVLFDLSIYKSAMATIHLLFDLSGTIQDWQVTRNKIRAESMGNMKGRPISNLISILKPKEGSYNFLNSGEVQYATRVAVPRGNINALVKILPKNGAFSADIEWLCDSLCIHFLLDKTKIQSHNTQTGKLGYLPGELESQEISKILPDEGNVIRPGVRIVRVALKNGSTTKMICDAISLEQDRMCVILKKLEGITVFL